METQLTKEIQGSIGKKSGCCTKECKYDQPTPSKVRNCPSHSKALPIDMFVQPNALGHQGKLHT